MHAMRIVCGGISIKWESQPKTRFSHDDIIMKCITHVYDITYDSVTLIVWSYMTIFG